MSEQNESPPPLPGGRREEMIQGLKNIAALADGYWSPDGQHDFSDDFIAFGDQAGEWIGDLGRRPWRCITVGDIRAARAVLQLFPALENKGMENCVALPVATGDQRAEVAAYIRQIADELAPEFARLLNEWLSSDMIFDSAEHHRLEQFLWDNKVGMLRVLERLAASPSPVSPAQSQTQQEEDDGHRS